MLEADPDLARHLGADDVAEAARRLRARVVTLPEGPWRPPQGGDVRGALGLLVVDGVLSRRAAIGEAGFTELMGSGDLLRPWETGGGGLVPCEVSWHVIREARVAVLNAAFARQVAHWPDLFGELLGRTVRRSRWQSVSAAIGQLKRVDDRLVVVMWQLAERWGRVTPAGVVIPLPLTHERLGGLVGAQRPSVTTALSGLVERGVLTRRPDRAWVLTSRAQRDLDRICARSSGAEALARVA